MKVSTGSMDFADQRATLYTMAITDAPSLIRELLTMKMEIPPINRPITLLENLPAIALCMDMATHEILYANCHTRKIFGDIQGERCWQKLQKDQDCPCSFCPNDKLADKNGTPLRAYRWDFQNTLTGRWYDITEAAIREENGRLVKIQIAVDVTGEIEKRIKKKGLSGAQWNPPPDPAEMIMMCSSCHRIRDRLGKWKHPAMYIQENFGPQVSHGLCLSCARKLYPDIEI